MSVIDRSALLQFKAIINLGEFVQFAERFEAWLDHEIARLCQPHSVTHSEFGDDHTDSCYDPTSDEIYLHDDVFRSIGRSALYMVVMAYAEKHMNALCDMVQRQTNNPIPFKELNGRGLERAANYLTCVLGGLSAFDSREWKLLKAHSLLRNKIAHAGHTVKKTDKTKLDDLVKEGTVSVKELSPGSFGFELQQPAVCNLSSSFREFSRIILKDIKSRANS